MGSAPSSQIFSDTRFRIPAPQGPSQGDQGAQSPQQLQGLPWQDLHSVNSLENLLKIAITKKMRKTAYEKQSTNPQPHSSSSSSAPSGHAHSLFLVICPNPSHSASHSPNSLHSDATHMIGSSAHGSVMTSGGALGFGSHRLYRSFSRYPEPLESDLERPGIILNNCLFPSLSKIRHRFRRTGPTAPI